MIKQENIRNFSIIAHIDHGKSTLADRLLEHTGILGSRGIKEQVLDDMELEREKGITIKSKTVSLMYIEDSCEQIFNLNLIDTPGHVDFTYEVSRSLAACEGAILIVDASQGIEAQTLSNVYLALENELEIIPVINKIDLPNAEPDMIKKELEELLGVKKDEILTISAKNNIGIEKVFRNIIKRIPHPKGNPSKPLRALIFDSHYDSYRGVVGYIRMYEGALKEGMEIKLMETNQTFVVEEIGVFEPAMIPRKELSTGEVGYVITGVKDIKKFKVGDTITEEINPAEKPLPGYRDIKPMVYSGLYPVESNDYDSLKKALEKLHLNDASLVYESESSAALGFGFRCGFLGLLHMEIIQERLEREYDISLITTSPNTIYRIKKHNGEIKEIENPQKLPAPNEIEYMEEPFVVANIVLPEDYIGPVMEICQTKRGAYISMDYKSDKRVYLTYEIPLGEIMFDFFDLLKSRTRGYASLDYEMSGYKKADLVKLDILLNSEGIDALASIVHKEKAYERGKHIVEKLKKIIPRQIFDVTIQAAIGKKIIARENIKAIRKNVLDKCYGGDITRKRKLLEKQKEGKKRMKFIGKVEIPQEAFMAVLKLSGD